jgi:uncharacterized protein (DUF1810 family)
VNHPNDDPYDLERFITAQESDYDTAIEELQRGAKRSHWIWYVFPQVAGLGSSMMAERYAIQSREEGAAYLAHPILGARLAECASVLLQHTGKTAEDVMGYPDSLKLKSSMTLFAELSATDSVFQKVLNHYFSGAGDVRTTEYLAKHE